MGNAAGSKKKYVVLILLFLGWCLGNLDRFVINYSVVDITKDLGLSASAQGVILSSFFLGYALMQIPGGALADRFGYRKVIVTAIFMWSIFTILTGAAWSAVSLIAIRFLFGLGEGSFFPSGSKAIASWFPLNERSRAMALMLSSGAIMGIATPFIYAASSGTIGWQKLFYIIGAVGLVVSFFIFFFLKEPKRTAIQELPPGQPQAKPKSTLKTVLKTPMIWNLFIGYFSIYAVNWGLSAWMPTYMINVRGLDMTQVGTLSIFPSLAGIIAMLFSGYLLDRIPEGKDKKAGAVLAVLVGVCLYLMSNAGSIFLFITYQTIIGVLFAFIATLIASNCLKTMHESQVATANGFINTGAQLAGFLTPMLMGFMVDASGGSYNSAFVLLVVFAVLCAAALMLARPKATAQSQAIVDSVTN